MATYERGVGKPTVESILRALPNTEEARKGVLEWMHTAWDKQESEERDLESSQSSSGVSDDDNEDKQAAGDEGTKIPETQASTSRKEASQPPARTKRLVRLLASTQAGERGSTTDLGGLRSQKGPAASQGGPNRQKGPAASQGGPKRSSQQRTGKRSSRKQTPSESSSSSGGTSDTSSCESSDDHARQAHSSKRRRDSPSYTTNKRRKTGSNQESAVAGPSCFEPADLVRAKEGTVKVPSSMKDYLDKHLRKCLTKEEREALFKEYPRPDLDSCIPPKVDKFMAEFLGRRMPKDYDTELSKIQASVLGTVRPLSTAWRHLVEGGVEQDPEMVVQASEVMSMIQCTLCLLGNSVELISESRRGKILEAIDPSWVKYSSEVTPKTKSVLFGKEFQKSLTKKVEDDSALAQAASMTKRRKEKESTTLGPKKDGRKSSNFFRGGPPAKYGGRQGKSFFPYNTSFRDNNANRPRQFQNYQRQRPKPLFHEPRLPPRQNQRIPQRKP